MTFQTSLDTSLPFVTVSDSRRANGDRRVPDAAVSTQASSEIFMGQWSSNHPTSVAKTATLVARGTYGERVCAWLTARYPHKTADSVAADLRCPASSIRKMLERRSAPTFGLGLRMLDTYGPAFAAAVLPGCRWMSDAAVRERHARIDAAVTALLEEKDSIDAAISRRATSLVHPRDTRGEGA